MKDIRQFFDEQGLKKTNSLIKHLVDGDPINVDPLPIIPESEMKLYTVHGVLAGEYIDSEEEFNEYLKNNNYNPFDVGTVEYIRNCAGISDVIKFTSGNFVELLSVCDEYGYGVYNNERSIYRGKFTWEYFHGGLNLAYKAFRDRRIIFENDFYMKIEERNKQLCKSMREALNSIKD